MEHDAADVSAGPGCDKDAEEYNMRHPKRGVALILNHQEFADEAPRRGSSRDCENLCAELEKLGFETRVHKDLTYIALSAVLTESKRPELHSCFRLKAFGSAQSRRHIYPCFLFNVQRLHYYSKPRYQGKA